MRIEFRDHSVTLREGEFLMVPKGVQHRPSAAKECWILPIETIATVHTDDVISPLTKTIAAQLG